MDREKLYLLMEDSSLLTKETLPELKQLIEDYPYFPIPKFLYLKNLALLNDIHFGAELKRLAVSIPDRRKLYMYIDREKYEMLMNQIEQSEVQATDSFLLIDSFLSSHADDDTYQDTSSVMIQPSVSTDYIYWAFSKGMPKEEEESTTVKLKHHDLIDSFLQEDEQRIPGRGLVLEVKEEEVISASPVPEEEHKSLDDSYFTETLAQIYVKQKRYDKALQIIKNLSLKYPEKNVYFADQIRFLEKLIINTKK